MKSSAHLSVITNESRNDKSSDHQKPAIIKTKDLDMIDRQLKEVEKSIQTLLNGVIGNPFASIIRHINNTESNINEKTMDAWQKAMDTLKKNLIIWKEYFGSATCMLLDANLKEEAKRLKNEYLLSDDQIGDITENIQLCTYDVLREIMEINTIGNIATKGGLKLDPKKRITTIPETIKAPMAGGTKGTIPQLLIVIDMINLMIAKVTLKNIKVVIKSLQNLGVLVGDILDTGETPDEHK